MASKIGVSRPAYIQLEQGRRELKITEARKLAAVFGMSLEGFLAGREPKHEVNIIKGSSKPGGRKNPAACKSA